MSIVKRLNLNKKQREEFIQLMRTSLSTKPMDWLVWKYIENPMIYGKPTVFGAVDKNTGELVGIRPFQACNVILGDKTFKAVQPCDTVVHPNFRGRGLFTKMNKVAIEELSKEGYDLFFNFPNRNSQPGNLKMGWKKVMMIDESLAFNSFSKVVKDMTNNSFYELGGKLLSIGMPNLIKIIERLNKKINILRLKYNVSLEKTFFYDEIENLWGEKEPYRFRVKRDSIYLNWRFKDRPDKKYKYWTIRENKKLLGYMITTISNRWGSKEGQIVDFQFYEINHFLTLLETVLQDFHISSKCNFVSMLSCTEDEVFNELKNIGFIRRFQFPFKLAMPEKNFLVRGLSPEVLKYDIYNDNMWSIRSGDQDTY